MHEKIPKLRLFINFLLILEICIGLALIITAAYFQSVLGTFLTETESSIVSAKFFNVYILGFQLTVLYLCSLSMWSSIWPRRYSENIHLLLTIWLMFCCLIVICGCFTIWSLVISGDALADGIEMTLLRGMDIYYVNPEWKFLWDQMQYTKECCGVHSYKDWMGASWMTENLNAITSRNSRNLQNRTHHKQISKSRPLNDLGLPLYDTADSFSTYVDPEYIFMESTIEKQPNQVDRITETVEKTLAPYACCKHASESCYENYMPQISGGKTSIVHLNLTDINTNGCLEQFNKYLSMAITVIFILILLAVLIDIILCCLTKYVMASNYRRGYGECNNDFSVYDDEGNALVVIKCPPKVRCITLEEPNTYSGSDIPNVVSSSDSCPCCVDTCNNRCNDS